jgi:glutamate transport system permease protein
MMHALIENLPNLLSGLTMTLALFAVSAVCTIIVGTVLSLMRISPLPSLNGAASIYVEMMRATPVVLVFFFVCFGLPSLGVRVPFFVYAVIALTLYESSYVCEALRSGYNSVAIGQAEAARSIGMSGANMLWRIILPQAVANSVPAIGNNMIALCKATAIAGSFGVMEATAMLHKLALDNPGEIFFLFGGVAAGYALINVTLGLLIRIYEKKVLIHT